MKVPSITVFAFGLAAQQAVATWNVNAPGFRNPKNNDNKCEDSQKSGFDWKDLNPGSFSSFGGYSFSGFTCQNSFGKRDALTKRTFQSKCITGKLSKSNGPSFSCGEKPGFSITDLQLSSSRDVDVELHFTMGDGSACKQVESCKSGGSVVSNKQCGGAKQVTFKLPSHEKEDCDFGIHSVGFDCSPPASTVPPQSPPTPSPSSSTLSTSTTSSPLVPSSSPVVPPSNANSSVPVSSPLASSPVVSIPTLSSPASSSPASSSPNSPVTTSQPSSPASSSPASSSPNSPVTTSQPSSPASSSPAPPVPTAGCPPVLPKCLNSWMFQTGCKDNSDFSCYCKQANFTSSVQGCVSAWAADNTEISQALSFLVGICAQFVPENPGLVTNCPSSIPIGVPSPTAAPPAASSPNSPVQSAPESYTTVVVSTTVTTCPVGQVVTSEGKTSTLTSPSVSTILVTQTQTVCNKCNGAPGAPTTPASSPNSPVTPAPQPTPLIPIPAPVVPVTTIVVSQTVTVPCTVSEGASKGKTIEGSSTVSTMTTSVTVPAVAFTTAPAVAGATGSASPSVGLAATPQAPVPGAPAPATPAPATSTGKPQTFGTTTTASPSASKSAPVQFTGAAVKVGAGSFGGLAMGGVLAFLAL